MAKILISGGAGFIGSNFIRNFIKTHPSETVINYDLLTYAGNVRNLDGIKSEHYHFIKGDVADAAAVRKAIRQADYVVHFAAESHVTRSEQEPERFYRSNVKGTEVMLREAKRAKVKKFIHVSCYDTKTRALTTNGFKTFKELKKGDEVISLNPDTQDIEIKPIEKVIFQSYKGKMFHFNNKRIDLLVTPNHNMYIFNTAKKMRVEPAEKAAQRSIFFMPKGTWKGKKQIYLKVKNHGRVKLKDLLYVLGVFIGDGFVAYQEQRRHTVTGLARREFLLKARDEITGKFRKIERQGNHVSRLTCHRIFFDVPETDKCRARLESALSNLGINYFPHKGKAGTHLYFSSKSFYELFIQCGKGARNKQIPRWALDYSPEYLKYLLEGLLDSDGCKGYIYHTTSQKLVANFCELCFKLGLTPNILVRHCKSFFQGRKIEGKAYCISFGRTIKSISRRRIRTANYKGIVWCIKVKDNKNFIVERNGRLNFCGNTDEVYGPIVKGYFKEEDKEPGYHQATSVYAKSKSQADDLAQSFFEKLPLIIVRPTNNFGPYQHPEKALPRWITNLLLGERAPVWGEGRQVRDWLYVGDTFEAINLLLKKGQTGEIYNIGTCRQREVNNREIAYIIAKIMGKSESEIELVPDPRPDHDFRYGLNCSKINALGWKPKRTLEEDLRETIKFYKNNLSWWKLLKKEAEKIYKS